ncbi:cytochrome P450 4c21-like isoform X1 [Montipora capricornis]|uniref:cytochrome P450 4c21-like isoform X1 n=1 Tax=Montipora capricornis TaxID=246305 RepID=UPI0035F21813
MILEILADITGLKFLFLFAFVLLLSWLTYKVVEEKLSPLQRIPCPPGALPLIGHLVTLFRSGGFLKMIRIWTEQYPSLFIVHPGFGIGIGGYMVYVSDPELIRFVTVKNPHKFERTKFVSLVVPSISKGLFVAVGKAHARQKRIIGPAFSSANLQGFLGIFLENSKNLVKHWGNQLKKHEHSIDIELLDDLSHLTLDVIGQTAFGYNFNTILAGESKVSRAFATVSHALDFKYLICKFLIPYFDYLPLAVNKKLQIAKEISDDIVLKVIQERRRQKREGSYSPVNKDLLDLLMDMYDEETDSRMSDEELRSQVFTFILAGNETTSVSMAWTLYELAKNPQIQETLRMEIEAAFPDEEELTWEKLDKLQYLENVVKESLRLHPPGDITARVALLDVEIGGYFVPAGTYIILPIDAMQRCSSFWPDSEKFNPKRFEENDEQSSTHSYTYFPFGCGPRKCIGYKFALMEMKVVIATLVKKFSFSEVPGCVVKEVNKGTTQPDGLKLRIATIQT